MHTTLTRCTAVLAVALFFAPNALAECGDCNDDGRADVLDALFTAQYTLGIEPIPGDHQSCNLSGDDQLDVMDVLLLVQLAVGTRQANLNCAPVDLEVRVASAANGPVPERVSTTGTTDILYAIRSPLFLDSSATLEWTLSNGAGPWYPATPAQNQPVDERLPTTSALTIRHFQWDSGLDLEGLPISQTSIIRVRAQSFVYEEVTVVDPLSGNTSTSTVRTAAGSVILQYLP